jgi:hypothetical protein
MVDVTFSTDPARRSVDTKELEKIREYKRERADPSTIDNQFIPMAVDAGGRWGPRMIEFFRKVEKHRLEKLGPLAGEFKRNLRYAKEQISIGVIKANSAYIYLLRHGKPMKETNSQETQVDNTEDEAHRGSKGTAPAQNGTLKSRAETIIDNPAARRSRVVIS